MNYCWYLKKIVTTIWRSQPHRSERYIDEKFAHTSSKCGKCARDFRSRSFLLNIKNSRKLDFKQIYFLWLKNKSCTGNVFFHRDIRGNFEKRANASLSLSWRTRERQSTCILGHISAIIAQLQQCEFARESSVDIAETPIEKRHRFRNGHILIRSLRYARTDVCFSYDSFILKRSVVS